MTTPSPYEVIIVGGGPAGLVAGLYSKRAGLNAVLFEKGLLGGQIAISKEVENYPGVEGITGFDLAENLVRQVRSFGLEVVQQEVVEILPGKDLHAVRLANGELYEAPALFLAGGGNARKLGVNGEAEYLGKGVSYCATCDGYFFKGHDVFVVGGGDTAVEEALHLSRLARRVTLIHRRKALRAGKLLRDRLADRPGVEILWNTIVTEIRGDGSGVRSIAIEDTVTGARGELPADGVFIFVGYTPNTLFIPPSIRMNEWGYIVTNEKCETSVPGIFAVGDLRQKFANQIVIAAADGAMAALAASSYIDLQKLHAAERA